MMPLGLFLGLRIGGSFRKLLLPLTALIVSISMLTATLGVMRGFESALKEQLLGLFPHLTLLSDNAEGVEIADWLARLEAEETVIAAAPVAALFALLSSQRDSQQLLLTGIDPHREQRVSNIGQFLPDGALQSLGPEQIILGARMAEKLGVEPGQTLKLLIPPLNRNRQQPQLRFLTVHALFNSGTEIDGQLALIDLATANQIIGLESGTAGFRLKLKEPLDAFLAGYRLTGKYPEFQAVSWQEIHGNLYHSLKLSKRLVIFLMMIVVLVASFNIAALQLLNIFERRGEIALLNCLGAKPSLLGSIVFVAGLKVGIMGIALGLLCGLVITGQLEGLIALAETLRGKPLLSEEVYFLSYVPAEIRLNDLIFTALTALLLISLVSALTAWRSSRLLPQQVLRWL